MRTIFFIITTVFICQNAFSITENANIFYLENIISDNIHYYINNNKVDKAKFEKNMSSLKEVKGTRVKKVENNVNISGYTAEDMNGVKYEVLIIKKENQVRKEINYIPD